MKFDYESSTRDAYKSSGVAARYHSDFTGRLSWRRFRFRYIATREQRAVELMLNKITARTILDIPCGTGKLAPILARPRYRTIAADVSADMLAIARQSYGAAGAPAHTEFHVTDVESVSRALAGGNVDAVVCLRLMHRVPRVVRARMLAELARVAKYIIVSFGIDSPYQSFRRRVRNALFGGGKGDDLCLDKTAVIEADLTDRFKILGKRWVSPFLSEEIVFLLEVRRSET
jgi:SAM-dependent methyltransferase